MNKEESDQKYGWRIHDDPVRATEIGVSVCPVCRESSELVQRQTSGFKNILSVCRHGHTCEIVKAVYEKYQVGDRIRRYESTFGKDQYFCTRRVFRRNPSVLHGYRDG